MNSYICHLLRSALLAVIGIAIYANACADNEECAVDRNVLACNLRAGQTTRYSVGDSAAASVRLTNRGPNPLKVIRVWNEPDAPNRWGEYCVSLNDWRMGQLVAGTGEVGCMAKDAKDNSFAELQWNGPLVGLSVAPGESIYIGGYVLEPTTQAQDQRKIVHVTVTNGDDGVNVYRQPRIDVSIKCSGESQTTEWSPWKNTAGRTLSITGAIVYAVDPIKGGSVDQACIYILESLSAKPRWQHCTKVNHRGLISFQPTAVSPNEYIAAQASNSCKAGLWDWAAYIFAK